MNDAYTASRLENQNASDVEMSTDDDSSELTELNCFSSRDCMLPEMLESDYSVYADDEMNSVSDGIEGLALTEDDISDDSELIELGKLSLGGTNEIPLIPSYENQQPVTFSFPDKPFYWMNDEKTLNFIIENFTPGSFYIMHDGKIVPDFEEFVRNHYGEHLVRYSFHLRLCAGKGGFGSLLRSFRVNKSTNKLMMRDLNGRRLASVDEEERLKRYLEKQARKEEELKEKRKAKLEKLTAGPAKHKFEDQDYLSKREEIIEKTEDACEAGFAYLKELKKKKIEKVDVQNDNEDDEDDLNVDDLFNERGGRKRKINAPNVGNDDNEKKARRDYEEELQNGSSDSEDESENEPDPEELEAIRQYFEQRKTDEVGESSKSSETNNEGKSSEDDPSTGDENIEQPEPRTRVYSSSNVDDLPKIDETTPCEYGPVTIEDYKGPEDLELLGMEHLKSALNERGLKCGGSLSERAARLWSVKGLTYRNYPKNILTLEMKKKIAEEEETEKKANKKGKKSKKSDKK